MRTEVTWDQRHGLSGRECVCKIQTDREQEREREYFREVTQLWPLVTSEQCQFQFRPSLWKGDMSDVTAWCSRLKMSSICGFLEERMRKKRRESGPIATSAGLMNRYIFKRAGSIWGSEVRKEVNNKRMQEQKEKEWRTQNHQDTN